MILPETAVVISKDGTWLKTPCHSLCHKATTTAADSDHLQRTVFASKAGSKS